MPMINCPNCGKKVSAYRKVCPNCGTNIVAAAKTSREESKPEPEREETDLEKSYKLLVTCLACDKKMSRNASICPNCGEPNPLATLNHSPQGESERTGATAGIIANILAVLGIFTIGTVFIPIAIIVAILGTTDALIGRNAGGIGINLLAWTLILVGLVLSPVLLSILGITIGALN